MGCARDGLTIQPSPRWSHATCWMGSIAIRRTTRSISRPPSFIIQKNCGPRWKRVGSCMKGRSLLKGHYGFHTTWSHISRTRSGANNFWRSHVGSKRNRLCLVPARIYWWLHAKRSHHTHAQKTLHFITYLLAALKMGVITVPDLVGEAHLPSMEQLAQALSFLSANWPALKPGPTSIPEAVGNRVVNTASAIKL